MNDLFNENEESLSISFFESNNAGYNYYILTRMLNLDSRNTEIIEFIIEQLVLLLSYDEALRYINLYRNNNGKKSANINYLEELINERLYYQSDCINNLKQVKRIENLFLEGKISEAINTCYNLYDISGIPDYIYLSAKIMYNCNNLEKSLELFKKYVKLGRFYLKEAYCYMYFICNNLKLEEENNYLLHIYNLICTNNEMDIESFKDRILLYKDNITKEDLVALRKDLYKNKFNTIQDNKVLINKHKKVINT